ncbi:PLAT domain-containing protein 3 [Lathyrus oleraceus]|uniref:PLAT domain-containing protein 2 n=1 Tax=Pisum sativum TaxID=3888 RepID=A0A9D4WQN5_PEA|nr:PLAT domain-containing protein 3-like [Pisum sativum]KAI5406019.1 PLAT domain-containing protein 2 [Pisum sativum]KAI5406020.1 variant 2, PLAT domain-containing protein 2 [Pisum sativum]
MANPTLLFTLLFLLSFFFATTVTSDEDCVYTVYVRTGSILRAGTDSNIILTLYNAKGYGIKINNLEAWGGLMGPGYNYFERGNLDIFSGRAPCLDGPVCQMNLTSDGSGDHHGWYVNYVEVTTTGVHSPCAQKLFTVEQWLATDTSPYELSFVTNNCPNTLGQAEAKLKAVDAVRSGSGSGSDFSILGSTVRV